jgi:hypothetical protein
MITYLKQQVLDARGEAERLRTELDRRIAARMESERDSERIIAEQAAALEQQSRQLIELSAALDSTREALADTRDEIRRAVGELQALPRPAPAADAPPSYDETESVPLDPDAAADEETADAGSLSGEEWADGREEAEAVGPPSEDAPADEEEPEAWEAPEPPEPEPPEPAIPAPADAAGLELGDAEAPADEPEPPDEEPEPEEPASAVPAPADAAGLELDEPDVEPAAPPPPVAAAHDFEPDFDLDVPLRRPQDRAPAIEDPAFDLDEPPLGAHEAPRTRPAPERDAPRTEQHEFDLAEHEAPEPAGRDAADDLDVPLPPSDDWLPVDLRSSGDAEAPGAAAEVAAPMGEAAAGDDEGEADFDDFLYDADELYDPDSPDAKRFGAPLESEIEARWPDDPATALPPPPPAPPSPWADEPDPPPPPDTDARGTLGKVLRGRGGRGRGRWEGSCSICGRLPQVTRRKDLQAAGWDLDDDAAACPQCRGVG